jgi:hypothetical protein
MAWIAAITDPLTDPLTGPCCVVTTIMHRLIRDLVLARYSNEGAIPTVHLEVGLRVLESAILVSCSFVLEAILVSCAT